MNEHVRKGRDRPSDGRDQHDDRHDDPAPPRWGQRVEGPTPRTRRELVGRELVAYRRMARGLSFSAIVLGLLLATGALTAAGPLGVVLLVAAAALIIVGIAGYVLVNTGRLPRHTGTTQPSRVRAVARTTAGRFAIGLAVLGLLMLGASSLVVPWVEDTPAEPLGMNLVLVSLMSALSCFVAAAIAVAIALLSEGRDEEPGADDDAPGSPGGGNPGGNPGRRRPVGYRSDWITRPRH